jgi:hypothetical protein
LSTTELIKVRDALARALSGDEVNQLGRDTGQAKRLRTVTPHRLFLAVVSALASAHVESLADLLRAFNYQNGVTVAYKAFYNRLARVGFATFMREMLARLVERLSEQTLTPAGQVAVARFTDIVIQDGSSFALKPTLRGTFPGRFTTIEPAAVEVHATYSGFADEVSAVQIAPDADAERPFLPDPATLKGRLLLADRGYPSVPYFEAVREQGGSFIVRLTRSYDPWVRTACGRRDAECLGGFFHRETSKEPHFNDLGAAGIELGQTGQRDVECTQFGGSVCTGFRKLIKIDVPRVRHARHMPAALGRLLLARGIDEHTPQDPRGDGEEMRAIPPLQHANLQQAKVSLIHQRGRL